MLFTVLEKLIMEALSKTILADKQTLVVLQHELESTVRDPIHRATVQWRNLFHKTLFK